MQITKEPILQLGYQIVFVSGALLALAGILVRLECMSQSEQLFDEKANSDGFTSSTTTHM